MTIYSFSPFGYEGALVAVEADIRKGIPSVDIVGLADGSVKEARERMKSAVTASGFAFPDGRVLLSLAPADLKKEGAGFDLAMALAVLDKQTPVEHATDTWLCYAELEISGKLRPLRGTYAALETAKAHGITKAIVAADVPDCEIPEGMTAWRVKNLKQARHITTLLSDNLEIPEVPRYKPDGIKFPVEGDGTLDGLKDTALLRAMMIAAAGRHHLLAVGKPGCGKTLALLHFPELLPELTAEEAQAVTRIHSLAGLVSGKDGTEMMRVPPFRMPHQTASIEGMCGGGSRMMPGEVSLAHNGVLFLDEAAEFKSSVLQMLRVPLESGAITLSRAGRSTSFPAGFQLLMATPPCPCGNYGSPDKLCLCSAHAVEQYWKKFSAPLLDRMSIRIFVTKEDEGSVDMTLSDIRDRIARATKIQRKRGAYNQRIPPAFLSTVCLMDSGAHKIFDRLTALSTRGKRNVLVVARTIADLEGEDRISGQHIQEAVRLVTREISCGL